MIDNALPLIQCRRFLRGSGLFLEIIVHRRVKTHRIAFFSCFAEPVQGLRIVFFGIFGVPLNFKTDLA